MSTVPFFLTGSLRLGYCRPKESPAAVKIHILSDEMASRIAAGEVVERPASVVKELIENSLDAGATEISISIEKSGTALIRVADNGEGMGPEDLALAVERHATSKLRNEEDLFRVATLGFRGEALPSIGSVAKMEITSRPPTVGDRLPDAGRRRQKRYALHRRVVRGNQRRDQRDFFQYTGAPEVSQIARYRAEPYLRCRESHGFSASGGTFSPVP